jgi:hypothetical protein
MGNGTISKEDDDGGDNRKDMRNKSLSNGKHVYIV